MQLYSWIYMCVWFIYVRISMYSSDMIRMFFMENLCSFPLGKLAWSIPNAAETCTKFCQDSVFVLPCIHNLSLEPANISARRTFEPQFVHLLVSSKGLGTESITLRYGDLVASQLASWHLEPSQPQGATSGLETNVNPSPSYSAPKSWNQKILWNPQN